RPTDAAVESLPPAAPLDDRATQVGSGRGAALARAARPRLRVIVMTSAVGVMAPVLGAAGWLLRGPSTHTVQLAAPPLQITKADRRSVQQPATLDFRPLPADRDWTLYLALKVLPTEQISPCTFGIQITAQVKADGQILRSFTSHPSQTALTQRIR